MAFLGLVFFTADVFTVVFFTAAFFTAAVFAVAFFTGVFFTGVAFADVFFLGAAALADTAFLATAAFGVRDFVTTGFAALVFRGEAFLAAGFLGAAALGLRAGAFSFSGAGISTASGTSVGGFTGSSEVEGVVAPFSGWPDESTTAGCVVSPSWEVVALSVRSKSLIEIPQYGVNDLHHILNAMRVAIKNPHPPHSS